jgi:hypothetical protein
MCDCFKLFESLHLLSWARLKYCVSHSVLLRTFFSAYAGGDELRPAFFFFREELQTALSAAQQQNNKQTMLCIAPLIYSWSVVSIFWFLHPHIFILCQQFSFQARNVKGSLSSLFILWKCYIQIVKMLILVPMLNRVLSQHRWVGRLTTNGKVRGSNSGYGYLGFCFFLPR